MTAAMKFGLVGGGLVLVAAGLWVANPSYAEKPYVEVTVEDGTTFHVFPPGKGFSIKVKADVISGTAPADLGYEWVDFRGRTLSNPAPLTPGKSQTIRSPSADMPVGYYGLKLLPADGVYFNPNSGERPEVGFAVLPKAADGKPDPDSRFGLVHFEVGDPYLSPGWIKTLTEVQAGWNGHGVDAAEWRAVLEKRHKRGEIELPLIAGDTWKLGSPQDVAAMMADLFTADPRFDDAPSVPAYELGIEENLAGGDYEAKLADRAEKFRLVQAEKAELAPSVKLAYQVANVDLAPYRALFGSPLGKQIDVLAAHPYPWHGWPSPDEWHDNFVDGLRAAMAAAGIDIPIWYTEVGAVQNDAHVPIIFSGVKPTGRALTRAEYAAYLVKLHAHAFAKGIAKVFWYNYRDRFTSTTDSEAHFGLRDYWGFPKPGYLAYAATLRCMRGRAAKDASADGVMRYVFSGTDGDCTVAWTADGTRSISIKDLHVREAFDTVGTPIDVSKGTIELGPYPVFLISGTAR